MTPMLVKPQILLMSLHPDNQILSINLNHVFYICLFHYFILQKTKINIRDINKTNRFQYDYAFNQGENIRDVFYNISSFFFSIKTRLHQARFQGLNKSFFLKAKYLMTRSDRTISLSMIPLLVRVQIFVMSFQLENQLFTTHVNHAFSITSFCPGQFVFLKTKLTI